VFLRLWEDNLKGASKDRAVIFWKNKPRGEQSNGYRERWAHVEAIKQGAQGFGVVRVRDPHEKPRLIADYEADALMQLTALTEDDRAIYAQTKWIPLERLKLFSRRNKEKSRRTGART
jgi:hypothetical protein